MKKLLLLFVGLVPLAALAQSNAPTNLKATSTAYNKVVLTWDDKSTNETRFEIERKDFTSFTKIDQVNANIVTYTDNTVSGSGTYIYRIKAIFVTNANYSNELTVMTPAEPPTTPTNLAASVQGANLIRVTWTNPGGGSATDFLLERGNSSGGPFSQIAVVPYSRTPTYDDNLALSGTQYCYRVRARGPGGTSNFSNVDCKTTPMAPTNVKNLQATTVSSSSIKLTWTPYGKESPITIERRTGQTGNWSAVKQTIADLDEFTDTGLNASTEYCYRIGEDGHDYSAIVCKTTSAPTPVPPVTPSGLMVSSISASQLQVFWTDANVVPVTFEISRTDKPGGTYTVIQADYAQKIYDDKNLSASTQYCYKVRAKNSAGLYSGYTSEVCNTTKAPPAVAPKAPADLIVNAVSGTQIDLKWTDASDNETEFQIERATGSSTAGFSKIKTVDANTTTFSDQTVQPNTQYCYRVRAANNVGSSDPTEIKCATTPPPPAGVPQNMTAIATSTTQIRVTWSAVAGAGGYQLERSPDGSSNWTTINSPAGTATSYDDNGLTPNTRYYYRIKAINAAGVPGDYSIVVNAITPDTPPAKPLRLSFTSIAYNQISLQWAAGSGNQTGFQIERSTDGANWNKLTDVDGSKTTYTDQTVQPQTHYYYRIRAVNGAGVSDPSDPIDTTTPVGPPAAPQNLTATAVSTTQIKLTWTAVATATSILIQRSLDGTNWTSLTTVAGNLTDYTDSGLTPNTRYYYRIQGTNTTGTGPFSNPANATTPDVPPAAPARLTPTAASISQINLAWADLSTNESGFEIERGSSATGTFTKIGEAVANATTYEDKNLTDNTAYCYRVRAKNAAGPSAYTDPACATTPLAPPASPAGLTAQIFDYDQIKLAWPALSPKAVTVIIERATNPNGPFSEIKQQPAGQIGYTDTGLQEFTTYYYRIRAINTAGPSGNSNVASARVEEVIIAVEDELETHTTLFVSQRTLHIITNWFTTAQTTLHLQTASGSLILTDNRKVHPADRWSYTLDALPTGLYIMTIVADGRKLAKRILLP